jgi:hypothetical protein
MENLKKAKIPVSEIPFVNSENEYLVRYRIVSEDKNRVSHWSQFLKVPGPAINPADYDNGAIVVTVKDITISWFDSPKRGSYDIFVKYGTGTSLGAATFTDYTYFGSSNSQSYTFLNVPTTANYVGVLVQVSGNKTLNSVLKIFEGTSTLKAEIDGGNASGV